MANKLLGNLLLVTTQANNADTTVDILTGYTILQIALQNTNGNAVTGGVKIGTTSGGTEVVVAQAVGANAILALKDAVVLKNLFSMSAPTTLFIQPVASWNSAVVNFQFVCVKLA